MKGFTKISIIFLLFYIALFVGINLLLVGNKERSDNSRNILMSRMLTEFENQNNEDFCINVDKDLYISKFGHKNYPDKIIYYSFESAESFNFSNFNSTEKENNKYVFPVKNKEGIAKGLVVFEYKNHWFAKSIIAVNSALFISFIIVIGYSIYIQKCILNPFSKLQEYPERLSLGQHSEKLPESKNKYFGKYIWAMNMLSDVLENEREKIKKLTKEKQVLTSTFAHGIKTPVANIKLYSNAIQTGLYSETINEKDAEIAKKIEKNADDIQNLVTNILDTSIRSLFEYEPKISSFYLDEIKSFIIQEYDNQFKLKKIKYSIEQNENPVINSDKAGICKILYQLIDNAIKYGNGSDVVIKLERQAENIYFSVTNKECKLPESEAPFIFNSFWRGSNAVNIEGQGIGLYEAKQIAKCLGGDIFAKINNLEIEVLFML